MDKKYWKDFYKTKKVSSDASLFAKFVKGAYVEKEHSLIELGCGNGRDCVFLAKDGVEVLAVDQCESEIADLRLKYNLPNLKFECADFTKLKDTHSFDIIYSRFTLHSIKEEEEDDVIAWSYKHLHNGGKFLIEARSTKNELYMKGEPVPGEENAYIYDNHYRRFIDTDKLREKLKRAGFEIILDEEENGFGGETNQRFFRMIAVKK